MICFLWCGNDYFVFYCGFFGVFVGVYVVVVFEKVVVGNVIFGFM